MSGASQNAITAKIHAMRGHRITSEQYRELFTRKTVQDIAAYLLSETRYAQTLAGVQPHTIHRGQLENLIREHRYGEYSKLMRFAQSGDEDFYKHYLAPAEIEQILRMIRLINDGTPELFALQYPRYIAPHMSVDFGAISNARDFSGLLSALSGTVYAKRLETCKPLPGVKIDYARCDTALFTQYYDRMHDIIEKRFSGAVRSDLNRIFGVATQLRNTIVIFRVKKFFQDTSTDELQRMLLPMRNRTARREIAALAAAPNIDAFVSEVRSSGFGRYIETSDFDYLEYRENAINHATMLRLLYSSSEAPVCFAAYMTLSTIEANNLIKIIESVYYNLPQDEAMKLLIME